MDNINSAAFQYVIEIYYTQAKVTGKVFFNVAKDLIFYNQQ